jgi:hypothetical protein
MPMLDTSKLEGKVGGAWVCGVPTKKTAKGEEYRCPVCARNGGDEGGQHLIVFSERPTFACAAYPGDGAHRAEIWKAVGVKNGGDGAEPFIPAKIEQKATFIGRHVVNMEKVAEEVRKLDASLVAARKERESEARRLRWEQEKLEYEREERKRVAEEAELARQNEAWRIERAKRLEEANTNSKCDKTRFGTFGTPILSSTNMPPPPYKDYTDGNTEGMGGGYAPPTCEKASQTSQVGLAYRSKTDEEVHAYEFDSADLGAVFDTRKHDWKEQYYRLWQKKHVMA